ncbi:Uncharacterised protein [Candidatus Anstonella stagnisolia]|nr:Uncharacterised protein [Candidatus Anstonella stagnisolia]
MDGKKSKERGQKEGKELEWSGKESKGKIRRPKTEDM